MALHRHQHSVKIKSCACLPTLRVLLEGLLKDSGTGATPSISVAPTELAMREIFLGTSSGVYGISCCDGCSFFAPFQAAQAVVAL